MYYVTYLCVALIFHHHAGVSILALGDVFITYVGDARLSKCLYI